MWLDSLLLVPGIKYISPGDGEEQGGLACCSPWGFKESDTTWQLNNNVYIYIYICICVYVCVYIYIL